VKLYLVEETDQSVRLRSLRRPALGRTGQIVAACAGWLVIWHVLVSYVLPENLAMAAWALCFVPLLAAPALARSVGAALFPDVLRFRKDGDVILIGERAYQRCHVHALRLQAQRRQKSTLWIKVTVTPPRTAELESSSAWPISTTPTKPKS